MEWKDISKSAGNVLERCWSIHHDRPLSFSAKIGGHVHGQLITEDTYKEILKYHKDNPEFDVSREGDIIKVKGNCDYGSWN